MLRGIKVPATGGDSGTSSASNKANNHKILTAGRVRVVGRRRRSWFLDDAPEVRSQFWHEPKALVRRRPGAEGNVVGYVIRDGELSALVVEHDNGRRGAYWLGEVTPVKQNAPVRRAKRAAQR